MGIRLMLMASTTVLSGSRKAMIAWFRSSTNAGCPIDSL